MDKTFQREVDALQASQQLHRQHRKPDGTDRQRDPQEDQAVGHGGGQQDQHGQRGENAACDLKEKHGAVNQQDTEPDQQGDGERHRRDEDFQDGFHGAGLLSFALLSLYLVWGISQGYEKKRGDSRSRRPTVH